MQAVLAVMYREYKIRITSLTWLFYDILMPFAYLLLFGIGLDSTFASGLETSGVAVRYNAFFLPSVLAMACFGIAINTSYGFFVDRDNGIFYEFLTYPMTRGQLLIGKITFNCLASVMQAILAVALGNLLLDVEVHWTLFPFILAGVVVGTAGWFFFLTIFALRIRRNDMFNTFINMAYFILLFVSSVFYPLDRMPGWFAVSSHLNPMTWHTDALRFLMLGTGDPGVIIIESILFSIFLLISFMFAVRTLQRSV